MSETLELQKPKMGETESMIQEYAEKVTQAIEIESKKIREKAEQDSSQIIAKARVASCGRRIGKTGGSQEPARGHHHRQRP
jgi:hypothetical protein